VFDRGHGHVAQGIDAPGEIAHAGDADEADEQCDEGGYEKAADEFEAEFDVFHGRLPGTEG
jgi:hypothetical protein